MRVCRRWEDILGQGEGKGYIYFGYKIISIIYILPISAWEYKYLPYRQNFRFKNKEGIIERFF